MAEAAVFEGGIAVITGAGGGIGSGIAHAAARAGMTVIATDIAELRLEATVAAIRGAGGRAHAHPVNVSDEGQMEALAEKVQRDFGPVRLLVNNAAVEAMGAVWEVPTSVWRSMMEINLIGVVNGLRAFVPRMLEGGEPAVIANVSSIGALGTMPGNGAYIASKAAILALTETLCVELELLGKPIRVAAVLPGGVATRILEDAYIDPRTSDFAGFIEGARDRIRSMMDPMEAGRLIFEGLSGDAFYLSTDPEQLAVTARARGVQLAGLRPPVDFGSVPRS